MMAAPQATFTDTALVLAGMLARVEGVRVYPAVLDKTRPPAVIIGPPRYDFTDPSGGFCFATQLYPVTLITVRNSDRDAQADLSRMVFDVVEALTVDTPDLFSVEPLDADTTTVNLNGQDLPGYLMTVRVRA